MYHFRVLYDQVNAYTTPLEEEQCSRKKILHFLKQPGDPLSRSNLEGHITASAFLLNRDCTKFLLMHHQKLTQWFQPGGHLDLGESPMDAAIREAKEESGIQDLFPILKDIYDLDVHLIPETITEPKHHHYDIRFLLKTNVDHCIKNKESLDLAWIPLKGYSQSTIPIQASIERMILKTHWEKIATAIQNHSRA